MSDESELNALLCAIEWHDIKDEPPYTETNYIILRENGAGILVLEIARWDASIGWMTQDDPDDWGSWCGPVKWIKKWASI